MLLVGNDVNVSPEKVFLPHVLRKVRLHPVQAVVVLGVALLDRDHGSTTAEGHQVVLIAFEINVPAGQGPELELGHDSVTDLNSLAVVDFEASLLASEESGVVLGRTSTQGLLATGLVDCKVKQKPMM